MALSDILKNTAKYGDDLEVSFGDEKVKLGDLRTLTASEQKALSDELARQQARTADLNDLATKTATLLNQNEQERARAAERNAAPPPDDWDKLYDNDPSYAPVRKRFSTLEQELKSAKELLTKQQQDLQNASAIAIDRFWQDDYRAHSSRLKGDKYKDYRGQDGYRKLAQYANDHKLLDNYGLPSVTRAIDELTKTDAVDAAAQEAYEKGLREGQQRARLGTQARPSSGGNKGAGAKPPAGLAPDANFNDLEDAVMDDPEMREMLSQLSAMDIGSLEQ